MKFKQVLSLASAAAMCFVISTTCAQSGQGQPTPTTLIAAGSGVNLAITRILANAFMTRHPGTTIEVPESIGSNGAIKAIAAGAITIGLLSRPLKEEEKSPGIVVRPYARVPIVVGVHPSVPDEEITSRELVDVTRGTRTRWKDGGEIIVLSREPFDSGIQVFQEEIPGFREAYAESHQANRWAVQFTDQDANRALSTTPRAIGFTDLGMIKTEQLPIKVLRLNGIVPGPESLAAGQYKLARDLSFLVREETLPEGAKAFIDFVRSEEGRDLLKSSGYLPLN